MFHPNSDRKGGILALSPVSIGLDNKELQVLAVAVTSVEAERERTNEFNHDIGPVFHPEDKFANTGWRAIGYVHGRDCYNLGFRGVRFEVPVTEIKAAVQEIKAYLGETVCFQD